MFEDVSKVLRTQPSKWRETDVGKSLVDSLTDWKPMGGDTVLIMF